MSTPLSQLEKKLQTLIEVHLIKYLPGAGLNEKIAQSLTEATNAAIQACEGDDSALLNEQFVFTVHPSTLAQWNKDARLLDGLNKIFRLAVNETSLKFKNTPTITIESDPTLSPGEIRAHVKPDASLESTNKIAPPEMDENPGGKSAFLIVGGTKVFTISQTVTNIGRKLDNQIVVDDPRVSRYHAQIRYTRGRFMLFDLNSTGGTYVNGQRTTQAALYAGDVISLAGLPIVFGQDTPPQSISSGSTSPLSPAAANRPTASLPPLEQQ